MQTLTQLTPYPLWQDVVEHIEQGHRLSESEALLAIQVAPVGARAEVNRLSVDAMVLIRLQGMGFG